MLAHEPKPAPRLSRAFIGALIAAAIAATIASALSHIAWVACFIASSALFVVIALLVHNHMLREWESGRIKYPFIET